MSVSRRTVLATAAGTAAAYASSGQQAQAAAGPAPASTVRTLRAAADYAVDKVRSVAPGVNGFPVGTKFEKWVYSQNGDWVGGFWPGTLWMAWLHTGDGAFRTWALESAQKLAPRQNDTSTHDLGFLFYPSWVTAWRLTGEDTWRAGAVRAADSLIQRYNPRGRFIRAWGALNDPNNAGRIIIDTMMNLDLLAFASKQTGDDTYLNIAVEHAKTAQRVFLRPDGSTPHAFDIDPDSGAPIGQATVQGYSPTSCWSRGQAWGVYGFTTIHRRTGNQQFLATARKLADFAIDALGSDHVPVWDYRAPQQPYDIKDASAGAIMACGLLDLSAVTDSQKYRDAALRLLTALSETCLTRNSSRAEAVVARCTRNRPAEDGIEISLPYADYYLLEGILRVLRPGDVDRAIDLSAL
ncbi:glycoside hydrolase family 88 protein [Streptomyces sp. MI02-2A]|uniref:glycoside hydrolase family 88 protein n=1 Tax=unclassified Streptomyces TaxID=2593676 RepID=UPI000A8A3A67|nr:MULTISPECIES: glycoside hydrolase family 88 protein [unclassified Streptomyces]MDX3266004.1 glycoside hydrolase family 88 protein [Streptomyces sp. MI02-2A]REE65453.1 unsaturated chondroitin disaccharide hydrolase [Streptomyces sp. 3212.3]